jgi:hypothetical protein
MVDAIADSACTAERLFAIVWETMSDLIGSAATAALVRRSAKRVTERNQQRECVSVTRVGIEFKYSVPAGWRAGDAEALSALRELAVELSPLLVELTGPVVIRRLVASTELVRCNILFGEPTS